MAEFQWTEAFSVGNGAIDADHQGLFALVAELQAADPGHVDLAEIIGRLEAYAAGHFAREEELMRNVGYPDYDAHLEEHESFTEWIHTVKRTYRLAAESPFHIGNAVNKHLADWLVNHIMKEDMKYRDFIVAQKAQ